MTILSGPCGVNAVWTLDQDSGVFTISGSGAAVQDGSYTSHRQEIIEIVVEEGITSIGEAMFSSCSALTSLHIANTVTRIDNLAFSSCTSLVNVHLGTGVERIDGAFAGCTALTEITFPASLSYIGMGTFSSCPHLTDMTFLGDPPTINNQHDWISGWPVVHLHTRKGWGSSEMVLGSATFIDDYTVRSDVSIHNDAIIWGDVTAESVRVTDPTLMNTTLATDSEGRLVPAQSSSDLNITPVQIYEED